jgi:hypothetical protein
MYITTSLLSHLQHSSCTTAHLSHINRQSSALSNGRTIRHLLSAFASYRTGGPNGTALDPLSLHVHQPVNSTAPVSSRRSTSKQLISKKYRGRICKLLSIRACPKHTLCASPHTQAVSSSRAAVPTSTEPGLAASSPDTLAVPTAHTQAAYPVPGPPQHAV